MLKKVLVLILSISLAGFVFSEGKEKDKDNLHPKTGFPMITEKPFVSFDYGVSYSWVNRIIFQEEYGRSNFHFQDQLAGAYISMQTFNMKPLNSLIRLAGYYPLSFTFNGVPQTSKNILRGSADLFAGIIFEFDMWNYIRINLAPGLHTLYQYSDKFHYVHVGAGALVNVELPLAKTWTLKVDGLLSYDYGNFGTNANIEVYDACYQYQLDVGFRYSKKQSNKYNYLKQNEK